MILITGGSGLLGQELRKYIKCDAPTSKELDITKPETLKGSYELIIHCAAYTDVAKAEKEPTECLRVNVMGTLNLLRAFPDTPIVYISSEYAKEPVNFYSYTKLLAEEVISAYGMGYEGISYLIIRTLFKPDVWEWDNAFIDSWTQGDSVSIIAPLIAKQIKEWDRVHLKEIYVGTGRKRIYDIAIKSKPNVRPSSIKEIKSVKLPTDYEA